MINYFYRVSEVVGETKKSFLTGRNTENIDLSVITENSFYQYTLFKALHKVTFNNI